MSADKSKSDKKSCPDAATAKVPPSVEERLEAAEERISNLEEAQLKLLQNLQS